MVALPPIFHVGSNAPSSQVWSGPRGAALTVVVVAADRPPVRVEEVHTVGSLPLQEASGLFDHASVSVVEPDQDRPLGDGILVTLLPHLRDATCHPAGRRTRDGPSRDPGGGPDAGPDGRSDSRNGEGRGTCQKTRNSARGAP